MCCLIQDHYVKGTNEKLPLNLFPAFSSMNGKRYKSCSYWIGWKISILFCKIPRSVKMSQRTPDPTWPSGSNSGAKGNKAFQLPTFPRYPLRFFSLMQNNCRKWRKDGIFFLPRRRHWNRAETHLAVLHLHNHELEEVGRIKWIKADQRDRESQIVTSSQSNMHTLPEWTPRLHFLQHSFVLHRPFRI